MDIIDNAVTKAKEVIDVACKKTNEVVSTQKQKFDIATIENKRSKDFESLGEIYFNKIKDDNIEDSNVVELVSAIKNKNEKIQKLTDEINSTKNKRICPKCGATIDNSSKYCNVCGEKIIFESDDE